MVDQDNGQNVQASLGNGAWSDSDRAELVPLCKSCEDNGIDYIDPAGNTWHRKCYDAFVREYNAFLDTIYTGR